MDSTAAIQTFCLMLYSKIISDKLTLQEALILLKKVSEDAHSIDFTQQNQEVLDRVIKKVDLQQCQTGVTSTRNVGGIR